MDMLQGILNCVLPAQELLWFVAILLPWGSKADGRAYVTTRIVASSPLLVVRDIWLW